MIIGKILRYTYWIAVFVAMLAIWGFGWTLVRRLHLFINSYTASVWLFLSTGIFLYVCAFVVLFAAMLSIDAFFQRLARKLKLSDKEI
jgi:hypothetical protein